MSFHTMGELYACLSWTPGRRPSALAHRGAPPRGLPENSLATYERALAEAPCWIEVDARRSRDGVFVLNHDATLDRCTTGAGPLAEHTFAQLRALRLRDADGNVTGHSMPTLDEAIELARGRTVIFLDVKDGPEHYAEAVRYMRRRDAHLFCVTLTYRIEDTLAVHRADPEACVYGRATNAGFADELLGCGIPHDRLVAWIHDETPPSVFARLHARGILATYGTFLEIDRRAEKEGLALYHEKLAMGADILNTDNIPQCVQVIRSLQGV